ncbi:MAG: hypothetical protein R3B48_09075 [Kofleriaceae bacterium]
MDHRRWLTSIAGAALALGCACDTPTGLVVNVQGAASAKSLWLSVGKADDGSQRFAQQEETGKIPHAPPYADGFEIYLHRDALLQGRQVALVLDAIVDVDGKPQVNRASYLVKPDAQALLEVELAPSRIGPGQWVCAGRPDTPDAPGFTIARGGAEQDCDRDGWRRSEDPEDADPLITRSVRWDGSSGCVVTVNGRGIRVNLPATVCGECGGGMDDECDSALRAATAIKCAVPSGGPAFPVKELLPNAGPNPDWELVRLGPLGARAVFAPSAASPDQWSVEFLSVGAKFGWFVLNDLSTDASRLIVVDFKDANEDAKCE